MAAARTKPGASKETPESTDANDGRVLRGARNHEAIVQAMYDLVKATGAPPSVEDVAARAGVGTRTVFRQFEDLEALYRSMGERVEREILALVSPTAPSGNLEDDVRAVVARRARIFEHLTPFRRVGRLVRHQSAVLQEQDARATKAFRAALEAVVRPHLGAWADAGTDADARQAASNALEALDALLSFEAWDRLRDQQKLSAKRAEAVLVDAALTLANAACALRGRPPKR